MQCVLLHILCDWNLLLWALLSADVTCWCCRGYVCCRPVQHQKQQQQQQPCHPLPLLAPLPPQALCTSPPPPPLLRTWSQMQVGCGSMYYWLFWFAYLLAASACDQLWDHHYHCYTLGARSRCAGSVCFCCFCFCCWQRLLAYNKQVLLLFFESPSALLLFTVFFLVFSSTYWVCAMFAG
jgi:hypothetical protein